MLTHSCPQSPVVSGSCRRAKVSRRTRSNQKRKLARRMTQCTPHPRYMMASFLFWLDLVLLLTFALHQEPETTGLWGHEWISIGLAALLFLHLLVNWRW